MANAQAKDSTAAVNEALAALPIDVKAIEEAFKATAAMNEKLAGVALGAAEKTNEIAFGTNKEAIAALLEVGKANVEPADYAKALTDFAQFTGEQVAKNFSFYAEIAREAQAEAVELMVAAGKDASNEAAAVLQKATNEATKVAKKAAKAA